MNEKIIINADGSIDIEDGTYKNPTQTSTGSLVYTVKPNYRLRHYLINKYYKKRG